MRSHKLTIINKINKIIFKVKNNWKIKINKMKQIKNKII